MEDNKKVDEREYDQLDALTSSPSIEISRLSLIIKDMRQRMESLEKNQTELMDKINELQREAEEEDDGDDDSD